MLEAKSDFVIIDLDSGTVLGSNVVAVPDALMSEGLSESECVELAQLYGRDLLLKPAGV